MKQIYVLVVLVAAVDLIVAQGDQTFPGPCPAAPNITNFTAPQFSGLWYEIKRYPNTLIEGDCGAANYIWSTNNYTVQYTARSGTNSTITKSFDLRPVFNQNSTSGRFDVLINGTRQQIPHYIIDTDYANYGVVWGCTLRGANNIQRLFIYGRQTSLSNGTLNGINVALSRLNINTNALINSVQNNTRCGRRDGNGGSMAIISIPLFLFSLFSAIYKNA